MLTGGTHWRYAGRSFERRHDEVPHVSRYTFSNVCLNVHRFPPPSSHTYELRYIGAETREEEALEWLPEAVVLERFINRWDGELAAMLLDRDFTSEKEAYARFLCVRSFYESHVRTSEK
ncbi:hypothetical protein DPX16_10596 [Anabarilius grahami]|uniref:Uncharacterized protein n=1 Tax=Anabarilius grahami TaxID=495550 RepID=A0A3N0Z770_ANAGA|nr:hypothetical protein DPX16_10596 [Anabarilius grahami]